MSQFNWKLIGGCPGWQCDERLWHAGLSEDGTKCFIAGFDDNVYIVWSIRERRVVWRDDGSDGESDFESLNEWIDSDGYLSVLDQSAKGRYRIFGLNHNHARTQSDALDQSLEVDQRMGVVRVINRTSKSVVSELTFKAFSGDWAFASFSDNDRMLAVIEPYSVTFFDRE